MKKENSNFSFLVSCFTRNCSINVTYLKWKREVWLDKWKANLPDLGANRSRLAQRKMWQCASWLHSPQLFQDSQTHNLADAGTQSIKIKSVYLIFRPNIQFQGRQSTLEASVACLGLTSLKVLSGATAICRKTPLASQTAISVDTHHRCQHTALSFDPPAGEDRAYRSGGGTPQLP